MFKDNDKPFSFWTSPTLLLVINLLALMVNLLLLIWNLRVLLA